jgi:hypothetical protein
MITNLIHKFLVHSHKLYKIKFLYMFWAKCAHHQEVKTQIVHMQPLVSSHSASDRLVQPLRKDYLSGCTRRSLAESDDTRGCICIICVVDLLMMSGLRSKYVEEFNFIQFMWTNKKFVYQVGNNKKVKKFNKMSCLQGCTSLKATSTFSINSRNLFLSPSKLWVISFIASATLQ